MRHRIFNRLLLAGAVLAALAATPAWADDPQIPPSATNQYGRLRPVRLIPIPSTHRISPYPTEAQRREQVGHTYMRVLVDKYGSARQVDVLVSSGYALLDQAAIDAVKERWRWEPPPPECWESGVILSVAYVWSLGEPQPDPIYLDSPIYPAQARALKRAAGALSNIRSPARTK
jgi:TonB family protein